MTWATALTLLRILGAPAVLVLALHRDFVPAFWVFAVTALTDAADGMLARRMRQVTRLGALLDPLADKLLLIGAFIGLVQAGALEGWVLAVVLSREVIVSLGWLLTTLLLGDPSAAIRPLGKTATAIQMALAGLSLLALAFPPAAAAVWPAVRVLTWAAVALTVVSMLDYLIVGSRRFGQPD